MVMRESKDHSSGLWYPVFLSRTAIVKVCIYQDNTNNITLAHYFSCSFAGFCQFGNQIVVHLGDVPEIKSVCRVSILVLAID